MRCSTCHRDQLEACFRRGKRLLKTCPPCREKQAAAQRARAARDPEGYRAASRRRAKASRAVLQRKRRVLQPVLEVPSACLYCADALDVLGDIERPDLLVTDPPYGIKLKHPKHGKIAGDETMDVGYAVLALAIRMLRPGGQIYVFGDRKKPFDLERAGGKLIRVLEPLIWDKGPHGVGDCSHVWGPSWEYISVGERRPEFRDEDDVADLEERYWGLCNDYYDEILRGSRHLLDTSPSGDPRPSGDLKKMLRLHQADRDRKRRPGVLRYQRAKKIKGHPTPKPVDLLKKLIGVSSRLGDLVFDPFMGSGSTGVAAREMGRRFLGIELEERYARLAAERITAAKHDFVMATLEEGNRIERLIERGQSPFCDGCGMHNHACDCDPEEKLAG